MKKILIVSELIGGGVEKVNTFLAEYIDKTKFDVTVLSVTGRGIVASNKNKDINYKNLNCKSQSKAVMKMLRYFKLSSPDVIITSGGYDTYCSILYSRRVAKTCKSIYVQHSVYSENLKNKSFSQLLIHHYICKFINLFNKLDRVIFVSKGVKEDLQKYYKINESKIRVIYNPIIDEKICVKKTYTKSLCTKLITIGRLEEEKDQVTIIRALNNLVNKKVPVELYIVGEGSLKGKLIEYIKQLGLENKVTFMGYINDVFAVLSECDVFVLSSKHESFANVLIEAMYSGIPVISTDCFCGPREIIDKNKYGYLVPVGDYSILADKIEQVISSDNRALVAKARKFSLNFTIEKSVKNYEKVIKELFS